MARKRTSKKLKIPGVSFSAKRAWGVTKIKRTIARKTGIPTTKSGRRRKLGRMMTGGGCLIPTLIVIVAAVVGCVLIVGLFV